MKKFITIFIILTLCISTLYSKDYIEIDEIKEGMKGYGYTIIQGTNISKFDITVLSVMRKSRGNKDAILIRLDGDYFNHIGVVAGMSGSPIYIEGKLAGALAFGWSYSKDPIAGVTPIGDMYDLYNVKTKEAVRTRKSSSSIDGGYSTLSIPLAFSGFSELSMNWFESTYKKMGFYTTIGGGSASITNGSKYFENGDGCAIVLVDGDISIAGVGTTTSTDKDKFLLFGHGMFDKGVFRAPVAKAYINSIIPSTLSSFKIGTPTYYVGYTTYDNMLGVVGVYGDIPKDMMIPINLTLKNSLIDSVNKEMNFRVINDSEYFPQMLSMAILSSLGSYAGNEGGTFTISYEIETDYYDKPFTMTSRVVNFTSKDSYDALIADILAPINFMLFNRFKAVSVKNIKIKLTHDKLNFAFIDDMSLIGQAKAGEKAYIRLGITEYGKPKSYKIVSLDIPKNTNPGAYILFAGNEYMYQNTDASLMPDKYAVKNLYDFMRIYSKPLSESVIKTWLYSSANALNIDGAILTDLPTSFYGMLRNTATTELSPVLTDISSVVKTECPILGRQMLLIQIESANK